VSLVVFCEGENGVDIAIWTARWLGIPLLFFEATCIVSFHRVLVLTAGFGLRPFFVTIHTRHASFFFTPGWMKLHMIGMRCGPVGMYLINTHDK
jgi:hypothetical protein